MCVTEYLSESSPDLRDNLSNVLHAGAVLTKDPQGSSVYTMHRWRMSEREREQGAIE